MVIRQQLEKESSYLAAAAAAGGIRSLNDYERGAGCPRDHLSSFQLPLHLPALPGELLLGVQRR